MFKAHCPVHGSDVLLGPRSILGLDNTDSGIVVRWRCHCGHRGAFRTGRHARPPGAARDAA